MSLVGSKEATAIMEQYEVLVESLSNGKTIGWYAYGPYTKEEAQRWADDLRGRAKWSRHGIKVVPVKPKTLSGTVQHS
jgi:hypothetical protein